jgi:hypothetical protein
MARTGLCSSELRPYLGRRCGYTSLKRCLRVVPVARELPLWQPLHRKASDVGAMRRLAWLIPQVVRGLRRLTVLRGDSGEARNASLRAWSGGSALDATHPKAPVWSSQKSPCDPSQLPPS